jgi:beta-galactosidase
LFIPAEAKTVWKDFYYGVCYYPEHWPPHRHASDIERMARAGFDVVRMGEGAWSTWEPREGHYQFDLFDRVIDLCRRHDIKVILGTPTYCAPAWVSHQYPEVLRWDFNRQPMRHGSRRNFNYTSPTYLDLSDRICTALAEHYKDDEQVIGWQLDNEFNCHVDVSYAPSDTAAFRAWLKDKYRSIERLNEAWGTAFWSQTYDTWEQVDLPGPTPAPPNPTQLLDETRFISDCVVRFAKRQADILRARNPNWRITHNGLFANVRGTDLVSDGGLDFFSHDQYPLFYERWPQFAANLVQARSLSFPYAIMEQQAGPGGQMTYLLRTPRPGQMRLWAWQSVAHGAKALCYFRWRTCPYGAEQHWHGLLDADDRDNRRLEEAEQTGEELRQPPAEFFDTPVDRVAAVLRDFDNEANDRRINTYTKEGQWEQHRWVEELSTRHVPVDMVWPESDWNGYRLLVAPHLKIVTPALAAKMRKFAEAGGVLVLGAQSALKDENCHVVEATPPGLLRTLAGIEVEDFTSLPNGEGRTATWEDGTSVELNAFVERLRLSTARTMSTWSAGEDALLAGAPAVTLNAVGRGEVWYVGGYAPNEALGTIAGRVLKGAGIEGVVDAAPDVETVSRGRYLCLLNHSASPQSVKNAGPGRELIEGAQADGELELPPYGVAVVRREA